MLWIAAGLSLGIALGRFFTPLWVWIAGISVLVAVGLALIRRGTAAAVLVAAAVGVCLYTSHEMRHVRLDSRPQIFSGVVLSSDLQSGGTPRCDIELISAGECIDSLRELKYPTRIRAYAAPHIRQLESLRPGVEIIFSGKPVSVAASTIHPEETGYRRLLESQGIYYTIFISPKGLIEIHDADGWHNALRRCHTAVCSDMMSLPMNGETRAFLTTTLLGNREWLPDDTGQALSRSGLAHIIALSGLHVGILVMILGVVLLPLNHVRLWWCRSAVIIAVLWGYALLTGLNPPVTRAVTMTTIMLVTLLCARLYSPLNALGTAAVLLLVWKPMMLFSPGFQLSFASVWGILMFTHHLNPWNSSSNGWLQRGGALVAVTVSATLATWLLVAYHFHSFPLMFLPANILVVPVLLPMLLVCGLATLVLWELNLPCGFMAMLADRLFAILSGILDLFGSERWSIELPPVSYFCLGAGVIVLFALKWWLIKRNTVRFSVLAASCLLCLVSLFTGSFFNNVPDEWFVTKGHRGTEIMVYNSGRLVLFSPYNLDSMQREAAASLAARRLDDYMRRRGICSVEVVTPVDSMAGIYADGWLQTVSGPVLVVNGPLPEQGAGELPIRTQAAVLCADFKGNIADIIQYCTPTKILIGADVHHSRRKRWLREAADLDVRVSVVGQKD